MIDLSKFEVYVVGGYVRDRLLGRVPTDHDFVVTGATADDMLRVGFKQVGADFPVFLHPVTGDEYALARTEQKVGPGYHGFEVSFAPSVTIVEDLYRRDLTINAMARRVFGWDKNFHAKLDDVIIDPFNGRQDLEDRLIRHVSEAFADDPVRALRAARFAARYGFDVHASTLMLIKRMVLDGELDNLTPERVLVELEKVVGCADPVKFFNILHQTGALQRVLPLIHKNFYIMRDNIEKLGSSELLLAGMLCGVPIEDVIHTLDAIKAPLKIKHVAGKLEILNNFWVGATHSEESIVDDMVSLFKRLDVVRSWGTFKDCVTIMHILHPTDDFSTLKAAAEAYAAIRFQINDETAPLKGPEIGAFVDAARRGAVKSLLQM